ncbi:MAG: pyrroline-5-carboxylate reductase [Phycisphaerae bacterium]
MDTVGFIGGGNMAEALINGITSAKVYPPENIVVSDVRPERLEYLKARFAVRTESDNASVSQAADILILSVKPQIMTEALNSIKGQLAPDALVISIAAGMKTSKITSVLGQIPIVRVMPNTPSLIGEGASAIYANDLAKPFLRKAERIFAAVGLAVFVEDEQLMDAVTAISGSGPAYFFLLMEEMIKSAEQMGLKSDIAKKLVLQTAKGAAMLSVEADKTGESPAELRKKVTSPGGTTEAAITFFNESKFGSIVTAAINKAAQRSRQLSK